MPLTPMQGNGVWLIQTDNTYTEAPTIRYELLFSKQKNFNEATLRNYAQPIDFADISIMQFLTSEASVTATLKDRFGNVLNTYNSINVGNYNAQNVHNITVNYPSPCPDLCYFEVSDGVSFFRSEPLRQAKNFIKVTASLLRNHVNIGYFINPNDDTYTFEHVFYLECNITDIKPYTEKDDFESSFGDIISTRLVHRTTFEIETFSSVPYYINKIASILFTLYDVHIYEKRCGLEYKRKITFMKGEFWNTTQSENTNLHQGRGTFTSEYLRTIGNAIEIEPDTPPQPENKVVYSFHAINNENNGAKTFVIPPVSYTFTTKEIIANPAANITSLLPQGFRFAISTTGATNPLDPSFATFLNIADFLSGSLIINAGSSILVRTSEFQDNLTDMVFALALYTNDAVNNNTTVDIPIPERSAFSDCLVQFFEDTNIIGISPSAPVRSAYASRLDTDFSDNLVEYPINNNVADLTAQITAQQLIAHIHYNNSTALPNTLQLENTYISPNSELGGVFNPNRVDFAPFASNPAAVEFDLINDDCRVDNFPIREAFDWALIPNNDFIVIKVTFTHSPSTFMISHGRGFNTGGSCLRVIASNRVVFQLLRNENPSGLNHTNWVNFNHTFIANQSYTVQAYIKKLSNTGSTTQKIDLNASFVIVNGRKINASSTEGTWTGTILPSTNFGNDYISLGRANISTTNFWAKKMQNVGFSISSTPDSIADQRRYAINPKVEIQKMQYAWIFNSIVNINEIPFVGTAVPLGNANAELINHTNLLTNLW